jgi:hypothetical protein
VVYEKKSQFFLSVVIIWDSDEVIDIKVHLEPTVCFIHIYCVVNWSKLKQIFPEKYLPDGNYISFTCNSVCGSSVFSIFPNRKPPSSKPSIFLVIHIV